MEHNVIEIDGIEYKAVTVTDSNSLCFGCAANADPELCKKITEIKLCIAPERPDESEVIYKQHYRLTGQTT